MAQLTKKAILMAFLNLLEQRPFEKITVRDIVVECGITRNTFYYHFEDVYAVLRELMTEQAERAGKSSGSPASLAQCFREAMGFALEHKRAAYHICCSSRREELFRYLSAQAEDVLGRYLLSLPSARGASQEDMNRLAHFYSNALLGLLKDWAEGGMKEDLDREICRTGELLEGSAQSALRLCAAK